LNGIRASLFLKFEIMKFFRTLFTTAISIITFQAMAMTTALPVDSTQFVTIILVRHAEKATADADTELSKTGKDRAERLVRVLKDANIDELHSTPFKRTSSTIAPIAGKLGKNIASYKTNDLTAFADALRKKWGKTILVAGHSNTTPNLVNLLIKENRFQQLDDAEYGKIFIVTIHKSGASEVVTLNY